MTPDKEQSIVFYDGVCMLCDSLIRHLIKIDKQKKLLFAPLQSERSNEILSPFGLEPKKLETIVFLSNNMVSTKSAAVLNIIQKLPFNILSLLLIAKIFPRFINDFIYDIIAKIRYRLFGKRENCRIPNRQELSRFLH